ncbi:MAG: signal peptidase II [Chiayiivirga sp.]|jgi:signal peptidase II|uniref:signal peptidase II n=1 Tax=Chiayiivirga sp. TaxID=2041042 RepID=UPI0025B9DE15|nr:signal peptidase II [Chiayiivirga sp.]MCI1728905.1 signal peptidase II [Chiayiivirga sp.]
MARVRPSALVWLLLSVAIIGLDLWTKALALAHLQLHEPVPVIDGLLNWTLTYNLGAAFSFLSDAGGWQRWFFSALAAGVSLLLVFWLSRLPRNDWRQAVPFALVIGGALGNLVDRVRFGHVVDFIDAYWGSYHWPAFNIADSAIVVGAIGLALSTLFTPARAADAAE